MVDSLQRADLQIVVDSITVHQLGHTMATALLRVTRAVGLHHCLL